MKKLSCDESEFDFKSTNQIAIINGQEWLHETEERLYKRLVDNGYTPIVIDNLFEYPQRVRVLKIMNVDTIVLGTTGTYVNKINSVMDEFSKLKWLPKNAIFTMGEDYFWKLKQNVNFWKVMPMYRDSEILIQKID